MDTFSLTIWVMILHGDGDDRRVKKIVICNFFVVTDLFIHGALTVLGVLENPLKHVRK